MNDFLTELRRRDITLWVDGENLRYSAPSGALTPELRAELGARKGELLETLQEEHEASETIPTTDRTAGTPLSFSQESLWILDQISPGAATYHIELCWRIRGPLDVEALERSLAEIARRHEILRTRLERDAHGRLVQIALPPAPRAIPIVRVGVGQLEHLAAEEAVRPFDLARGPLCRAVLARCGAEDHALLLAWHHLAFDGGSEAIFLHELTTLYTAFRAGQPSPLAELPVQFGDYAHWQREAFSRPQMQEHMAYWQRQLAGDRAPLALPADRPRAVQQSYRGANRELHFSPELSTALRQLCRVENVTLFMLLLAAWKALLARFTGETDLCVGSPIAQRTHAGTEPLIGFFVNMLALRTDAAGDPTFRDLLRRVRLTALDAFEHQDAPFEKIVEALQPARHLSHHPIFQVAFVLLSGEPALPRLPGLTLEPLAVAGTTAKFDLTLYISEHPGGLAAKLEYSTDLFDPATIDRLLGSFDLLLRSALAAPATPLSRLAIMDAAERERIVSGWNDTALDFPREATIHSLFEQSAAQNPTAIALLHGSERVTFGELNMRANAIAHQLRDAGAGRETFVGVCLQRSTHLPAALLGILKAGAAYLPMDPNYPADRLALMLEDSGARLVLCDATTAALPGLPPSSATWLRADLAAPGDFPNPDIAPAAAGDLAYLIYTSGSTGRPKGVALEHRQAVAFIHWARQTFSKEELAGVLASTSICFDLSVFEIFVPLATGGTIILAENILELPALAAASEVTLVNTVPSAMAELLRANGLPPNVRTVNLAGEALPESLVESLHRTGTVRRVCDLYGPTETTTYSTFTERRAGEPATIGRPIANTQIYVLDPHRQPVPIGVTGEIFIGGTGVARGYWRQPELTAARFVASPFVEGARLYRTGDLAHWCADGQLVYLGRSDQQVKVRGFRIEPGEIEAAMRLVPGVLDARAISRQGPAGLPQIVGYFVAEKASALSAADLRTALARTLPPHLIPTAFVPLPAIPLTPNGKLDRAALPPPGDAPPVVGEPPQSPLEHEIAALWTEILGRKNIGRHDDFFLIGGHSLLAIRLLGRVREKFGIDLPARSLFETPTVAAVAEFIGAQRAPASPAKKLHSLVPIQRGDDKQRPFFLVPGGWGGELEFLVYAMLKRHLGTDIPIFGLRARGSEPGTAAHETVPEMVADYVTEIRTRQPHGPYLLGGECIGGIVAYEMARLLEAQGEKVALLVLLDTGRPSPAALRRFRAAERGDERRRFWEARVRQPLRDHFRKLGRLGFRAKIRYIWERSKRKRTWPSASPGPLSPATTERKLAQHYPELLLAYPIGAFGGKVTLVIPEDSHRRFGHQGWDAVATGGLEVHVLPGDHVTYIRDHAASAGARLRQIIDQANRTIPL